MNSAAVIGRQLRQQQTTGRTSGPLVPPSPHRGRPRTPSQQPPPQALVVHQSSQQQQQHQQQQSKDKKKEEEKKKGLAKMKDCISLRCICLCVRALSGGIFMIAIGVGMTVFGFYADTFAVQTVQEGNKTVEVINENYKYHMHNLTFVGPVFMGLGGMLIVAACVMSFDNEPNARVAPIPGRRPSDAEGMLTEHLIDGPVTKTEKLNGPTSPFMNLSQVKTVVPEPAPPAHIPDKGGGIITTSTVAEVTPVAVIPNGPNREKRPELPSLPVRTSPPPPPPSSRPAPRTTNKKLRHFLSPLFDEFVPSPQDIQIPDPDGCTPDSSSVLEMDVYVTKCPKTVKVQLEPRYLASIESDGLSDSDTAESELTGGGGRRGRFCSPCEVEEQDIPLLGRCSPPSSPEYPMEPVLKRDSNRRFHLLRQVAIQDPAVVARLYDGPSSEGGGSR